MNTNRTTRFAGLIVAVLVTVAIHGALLWKFDAATHEGVVASSPTLPSVVTLETVHIVASRLS